MTRETRRKISTVIRYTLLILVGIIMVLSSDLDGNELL